MKNKKQKLELTWIGKDEELNIEPRILIEDTSKSYGDTNSENMLIHGDNLLALKALEQEFSNKIKCIFIDPPFNTQQAFQHYDDGIEHSIWLNLMKSRLAIMKKLLSDNGSIWIAIDDNEGHYLKVLCDEVFGRQSFIANVIWRSTDNSNNNAKTFSLDHNHILVYGKHSDWVPNFLNDLGKRKHFKNPDNDPQGPWFDGNPVNNPALRPNLQFDFEGPNGNMIPHPPNGWRWSKETMLEKMKIKELRFSDDGKRIVRRTYLKDMLGLPPSTMWFNLEETGHNRQAKYELKKLFPNMPVTDLFGTPKPERLLRKIIDLATDEGDWVLDSFAGSGTTGAVAHKMNRRWIMVEMGDHCYAFTNPRVNMVIDGSDQGGITEIVGWNKGGGLKFFELAPSLLRKDSFGNFVIDEQYNANMLAAAMCKHEGFKYSPDEAIYWKQGNSTETDYIFVTTGFVTVEQLDAIHSQMTENESLLICAKSFAPESENHFSNITIKKIPQMILGKCEFGKDNYDLNIIKAIEQEVTESSEVQDEQ